MFCPTLATHSLHVPITDCHIRYLSLLSFLRHSYQQGIYRDVLSLVTRQASVILLLFWHHLHPIHRFEHYIRIRHKIQHFPYAVFKENINKYSCVLYQYILIYWITSPKLTYGFQFQSATGNRGVGCCKLRSLKQKSSSSFAFFYEVLGLITHLCARGSIEKPARKCSEGSSWQSGGGGLHFSSWTGQQMSSLVALCLVYYIGK